MRDFQMMRSLYLSVSVALIGALGFVGCGDDEPSTDAGTDAGADAGADGGTDAGPSDAGPDGGPATNYTIHYHRPDLSYDSWSVTINDTDTYALGSEDGVGGVFEVVIPDGASSFSYQFNDGTNDDPASPITVSLADAPSALWHFSGGELNPLTREPPAIPGDNQVAIYYLRPDKDYALWGLHAWVPGGVDLVPGWSSPLLSSGTDDELGAYFLLDVPADEDTIGIIVHGTTPETAELKDPGPDMLFQRSLLGNMLWIRSGQTDFWPYPIAIPEFEIAGASAHFLSRDFLVWDAAGDAVSYELRYSLAADITTDGPNVIGGTAVALTEEAGGLPQALQDLWPHLANRPALRFPASELANLPQILKGQLVLVAKDASGTPVDATYVQTPGVLDDLFTYIGPLGLTFNGQVPTITLWAPTAQSVKLVRFDSDLQEVETLDMNATSSSAWSITGDNTWYGGYYQYEVRVYHYESNDIETLRTTDPYSVALSTNSEHSTIIDLDDPALKPAGWDSIAKPPLAAPEDIVIYEGHIRDFSAWDTAVDPAHRGKFKAFTYTGRDGNQSSAAMSHLEALAQAGLTHFHILPAFDIATVNEDESMRVDLEDGFDILCALNGSVPADACATHGTTPIVDVLSALDPSTGDAQEIAGWMRPFDSFNWGYDPFHYSAPEGSYATDPKGAARVLELREMVMGLNRIGLRTVLDVVYNHTNQGGLGPKSVLDKVVPGYYHRRNEDNGSIYTTTCCPNTATEHNMMERLMIDSLVLWAKQYKIDSFRFDLMGHHMKRNMVKALAAVQALTPGEDGVNGSEIYFYGEGWNFGEVVNGARGENAIQTNMGDTGIGTFSDRLRDAVRGGGPFDSAGELRRNQGFGNGLYFDPNEFNTANDTAKNALFLLADLIRVGMAGNLRTFRLVNRSGAVVQGSLVSYNGAPAGYTEDPQEVITYICKHDNQTLFDINAYKAPMGLSMDTRVRMHNVGMSIVGLGQGVPFFQMGTDLLRSKSMERDSYDSGDWFNKVDFTFQDSNWNKGLPNASKDQGNWPVVRNVIADSSITPTPANIDAARLHFQETLEIRKSSVLFRLETAEEVKTRVDYHNTGPNQIPGLIVQSITDGTCAGADLDPSYDSIVVVINANDEAQSFDFAAASGLSMELHSVLQGSADAVVRTASFESTNGTFSVPGRTAAVFVESQGGAQGAGLPCNTR